MTYQRFRGFSIQNKRFLWYLTRFSEIFLDKLRSAISHLEDLKKLHENEKKKNHLYQIS
jgi:hypothetical protein